MPYRHTAEEFINNRNEKQMDHNIALYSSHRIVSKAYDIKR